MALEFLLLWLLIGIDVVGEGQGTVLEPVPAGSELMKTLDGPTQQPPPTP